MVYVLYLTLYDDYSRSYSDVVEGIYQTKQKAEAAKAETEAEYKELHDDSVVAMYIQDYIVH